MARLPENIRRTLEKIVSQMRGAENVYGIGLFGSWSRGDSSTSSDIDIFVLEKSNLDYEYVERSEVAGLFLDFDHIPRNWMHGLIPPEIDQKLYEMQILYDRDWSLTNAKILMTKAYSSPERVDIRTEAHIIQSDIYLSRATSALSKEDYKSAHLFSTLALQNMLKVLVEIALEPMSNSQFLERLGRAAAKLNMQSSVKEYIEISGLENLTQNTSNKLKLFKAIWEEAKTEITNNQEALETSHPRIKTKLKYYLKQAFLQGVLLRAKTIAEQNKMDEAYHYLRNTLADMIESYVWFKSTLEKTKADPTTLLRTLKHMQRKNPETYCNIIEFLDLNDKDKQTATKTIEKTRKAIIEIRAERKTMIKNYLKNK